MPQLLIQHWQMLQLHATDVNKQLRHIRSYSTMFSVVAIATLLCMIMIIITDDYTSAKSSSLADFLSGCYI